MNSAGVVIAWENLLQRTPIVWLSQFNCRLFGGEALPSDRGCCEVTMPPPPQPTPVKKKEAPKVKEVLA